MFAAIHWSSVCSSGLSAAYPDAVYLILSLADQEAPVLRAFWIRDGRVDEEELERRTAGVAG